MPALVRSLQVPVGPAWEAGRGVAFVFCSLLPERA